MRCTARVAVVRPPHDSAMRRAICALDADPCRARSRPVAAATSRKKG